MNVTIPLHVLCPFIDIIIDHQYALAGLQTASGCKCNKILICGNYLYCLESVSAYGFIWSPLTDMAKGKKEKLIFQFFLITPL